VDIDAATRAVKELLEALGVDEGEHTADTPARVAHAYQDMLWGYREVPDDHLNTTFPAPPAPGLIAQAGIDVQSICAHHLLPFGGHATVAYRPYRGQRIVGLSKLTRLVYGYSARAQVQERIGQQVVDAIVTRLAPESSIAILSCSHDCMRLRGVRSPASVTTTIATRGNATRGDIEFVRDLHMRSG
jgi:GTP cyclohydrolase I